MRNFIKKIWKFLMYKISKFYILDKDIFLVNRLENIAKCNESYSQFGQDSYIYNKFFKNKVNGIFVDVGANHPVDCSNSYIFEQKGWTGLAIEPQERFRGLWKENRKTECLDYVIGEKAKKITFIDGGEEEHGLSGVEGYNKVSKNKQNKIEKDQVRLDFILISRNILNVDFLSVDVEGYEMEVLKSINFEKINIQVIVIENNIGFKWLPIVGKYFGNELGNNKIRRFLKNKGYKQVARIMCDDVFVKM